MQISFALDTANRKDLQLIHDTLGYMLGFIPVALGASQTAPAEAAAVSAPEATPAAQPTANALAEAPPQAEVPKPTRASRKKAAEVVTPSPLDGAVLNFRAVRAKLQAYSDDPRFGMVGVHAILNKYGVLKISALPEAQYPDFVKEIDDALASKPDPLA